MRQHDNSWSYVCVDGPRAGSRLSGDAGASESRSSLDPVGE